MADPNEADPNEPDQTVTDAKRALRQRMRTLRRELPDRPERSARVLELLTGIEAITGAKRLLAYDSIVGEVETPALVTWCTERGIETAMPEDDIEASWPDVIIVPGTAFTVRGERIGQGGGWYDRFLPGPPR